MYLNVLTSDIIVIGYMFGSPFFGWELKDKGEHKRNEALDCRNYATAAIEIINVPLKKPDKKKDATQAKKIVKRGRRRSGGIL